jgi:hypothetical protein
LPDDCGETLQYLDDSKGDDYKMNRTCRECPRGGICSKISRAENPSSIVAQPHYWRVPSEWIGKHRPLQNLTFHQCPFPKRCPGDVAGAGIGNNVSMDLAKNANVTMPLVTLCTEGTDTNHPLCAVCLPQWTKDGIGPCTPCRVGVIIQKWTVCIVVMVACLLAMFACRRAFKNKITKLRTLWLDILRVGSILLTFCQISYSVPDVVQIDWRKW